MTATVTDIRAARRARSFDHDDGLDAARGIVRGIVLVVVFFWAPLIVCLMWFGR